VPPEWLLSADATVRSVSHRLRLSCGEGRWPGGDAPMAGARGPARERAGLSRGRARGALSVPRSRGGRAPGRACPGACQGGEPGAVASRKWRNRSSVLGEGWVLTVAGGAFWGKRALERTDGALVMSLGCHMIGT
jgi:hypothetical protein